MRTVLVATLLFILQSTPVQEAADPKVEAAVAENLAVKEAQFWKECRAAAIEKASTLVDSLLLAQAPFTSQDTLPEPPRPERPDLEPVGMEEDTAPLKPFIHQNRR